MDQVPVRTARAMKTETGKSEEKADDKSGAQGGRGRALRIAVVLIFAGGLVAFFALGGRDYLNLETLQAQRETLRAYVEQNYALALAGGMLIYILATTFSIPGAIFLTLAMGFLFGRWIGGCAVIVAATIGATLVFLAVRYLFADTVKRMVGKRAEKISAGFREDAFNYLLFLRVVPLFPFWLVNVVPALAEVPARTFILATLIGITPGSFIFANLGQSLAEIESARELLSTQNLIAFGLLGLFALTPVLIKKIRKGRGHAPKKKE
ncbi:MAG: TVP38/TMEM64 family protein [Pseudomonadota bacterium]|nr:TVP38/TMEM64 family protein [Pseudomonadota bacterium]